MKNLFYFRHINIIGGIEQFFAYLAEKYKDWDITIVYKTGDPKQIARLRNYVRVEKFSGQKFTCDKAFFCFNTEIREYVDAKETALILHGDYKAMVEQSMLDKDCHIFFEKFDKYYGVSQLVCDSWTEMTGKPCEVVYNPFIKYPKKRLLKLVYCGRLAPEKGGNLAIDLLDALDLADVPYKLFVYSDKDTLKSDNVVHMGTRLDAGQFLNKDNFDFILVPSKNEGYCYSLIQALANGLPAIVTPCPVFAELGINESNSITLNFDGNNLDDVIKQMQEKEFNFTYEPKADNWNEILAEGKTTYEYTPVKIKALSNYLDAELGKRIMMGQIYETSTERARVIVKGGFAEFVKEE